MCVCGERQKVEELKQQRLMEEMGVSHRDIFRAQVQFTLICTIRQQA